jgi:hypothetical protein
MAIVNIIDLGEQARMNLYCLNAGGLDFPRVPSKKVKAFVASCYCQAAG